MYENKTLIENFILIAKELKNKVAIHDKFSDKILTYKKTLIASLILSKKIQKYDDSYIGIMIPFSAGTILTILATLMCGKIPVMINYSTKALINSRYAKNKCGFDIIITSSALLEKINCPTIKGMVFIEDIVKSISIFDKLMAGFVVSMPVNYILKKIDKITIDDIAVILFTSGSEKDPKAVQLTHKNILSNIIYSIERIHVTKEDIFLGILPLFHVFGYNVNLFLPLLLGSKNVTYVNPLEYKKIVKIIKEEKITTMAATPSFLAGYFSQASRGDLNSLKTVMSGADKTPLKIFKQYKEKHNIQILEGYGATETSPVVSINSSDNFKVGSIGRPLKNIKIKIVDNDTNIEVGTGVIGRILVKGDSVMPGYFDDLEETSLRIRDGWYDTGDMGYLDDDGFLWHKGRLRRFVKIGGEMISLVKIESILEDFLPDDIDCCIVEIPDQRKGSKIIAVTSKKVDPISIKKEMSKFLPNISIPKDFKIIENLPKMGSGKINFRKITDLVKEMYYKNDLS